MNDHPPNLSIRSLSHHDLDKCLRLESLINEKYSRLDKESMNYLLNKCPELCLGLFIRDYTYKYNSINQFEFSNEAEKNYMNNKNDSKKNINNENLICSILNENLIGFIIGSKVNNFFLDFLTPGKTKIDVLFDSYNESFRNIFIHSFAIEEKWQKKSLGSLLMNDYKQKLLNHDIGEKIIILSEKNLIQFFEKKGFTCNDDLEYKSNDLIFYKLVNDLTVENEI